MKYVSFFISFFLSVTFILAAEDIQPDLTVLIPMRDGKELPTDLYLPSPDTKGLPCILLRSPAGRKSPPWVEFAKMAKAGYVIAIQDTRNVLDTEGKTFPFLSDGWGKLKDGYDTVEWLAKSSYTNGKIGTWGSSALGITQLLMAPSNPPHLKCQYIVFAAASIYHHGLFPGGQLLKNQAENWLGLYARDTGVLNYVCNRPFYNDFWKELDSVKMANHVHVPGIHVGGWYDTFLQGTLSAFSSRQNEGGEGAKQKQKLIIGPWTHFWPLVKKLGDFDVPKAGLNPPFDVSPKAWFDYYLKDEKNDISKLPPVIYYVMGPFDGSASSGNVWRTADNWPVPSIKTPFYLTADLGLQENIPFQGLLFYKYDPLNFIPTMGGRNLFLESGPKDQSSIEDRDDILVFNSPTLKEDIEVTGNLSVQLYVLPDQQDTDIVIRLCDVYPDGRSILISDGIYRFGTMCHHEYMQTLPEAEYHPYFPINIVPDRPLKINVDLWATSIVFAKDHSIRLSISSSNYPRYEKNTNVGLIGANSSAPRSIKNTIYMGTPNPSQLILPIVRKGDKWLQPSLQSPSNRSL